MAWQPASMSSPMASAQVESSPMLALTTTWES